MKTVLYYIAVALLFVLNKLPLCVLHLFSTLLYYPMYYIVRYRRKVVRDNLVKSFPEKDLKEIIAIEKKFYRNLCDYFMEMIKYYGMSEEKIKRYMRFEGLEKFHEAVDAGHSCVLYMGHIFNWEYVTSITLHFNRDDVAVGAIYHPLENSRFDALVKKMRAQFGTEAITMANTLRRIMQISKEGKKYVIGFIADQVPTWESINHWLDFFHRDTPVFTGTEKIAQRTHAALFYAHVHREKRGHYVLRIDKMADDAASLPEFEATNMYYRLLSENIREVPELWLWTHNRWKRTREGYAKREAKRVEDRKRLVEREKRRLQQI